MQWYEILVGIVLVITSIALIAIVLLQESRAQGLGAIAGGADTFLGKGKSKTAEQKLAKITKILAIVFFVLALVSTLIVLFVK